jgi:hypothetical protein
MKKILVYIALSFALAVLSLPYPVSLHAQTSPHVKGRALLVGITQYAQPEVRRAPGAEEDALATKEFIKAQYGFDEAEIHVLLNQQATRDNIINEFQQWLIEGTAPGDRVFFLYSGHGSRLRDDNGDEPDGYDETLAPYDATLTGENQIRDDEINQWIEQLSGRIAVLVFDSCHSGTISRGAPGGASADTGATIGPRYLPSPEEFSRLEKMQKMRKMQTVARGDNRSGGVADYEVQELKPSGRSQARDLRLVEEKTADAGSGIVVVSAAQAGQLAYPVRLPEGGYRGALSYVFNEVQRGNRLPLAQLQQQISARIAALQQSGELKGKQVPAFDVISRFPRHDLPLFVGARERLEEFVNQNSSLKVSLRNLEKTRQYRLGDKISYEVETSAAGWLYLIVFSQEGKATCVFPNDTNQDDRDNRVRAGTHRLPRSQRFYAQDPIGKDVVIALLSSVKLDLGDKEEMTWEEVFDRLRSKRLAGYVKTRGVGTKKSGLSSHSLNEADWQAARLVIETIP